MKNKSLLFILLGIFVVCFIGGSIFFAQQGISAAHKRQEYFDVYRSQAEEYIKASSDIKNKYGDDISIDIDGTTTYSESGKGFFDRYIEVFAPNVPDTFEEFSKGIDMVSFELTINGDAYRITFEKDGKGYLAVSELVEMND